MNYRQFHILQLGTWLLACVAWLAVPLAAQQPEPDGGAESADDGGATPVWRWFTRADLQTEIARLQSEGEALSRQALAELERQTDGILKRQETATGGERLVLDRERLDDALTVEPLDTRELLARAFPGLHQRAMARYRIHYPPAEGPTPDTTHLVLLIHGLDEPGELWRDLIPELRAAGLTPAEFEYPNDQAISASAALLHQELARLKREHGVARVSIVAHSMGGLVSRELLTAPAFYAGISDGPETHPAIDRLITLGTPHQGSALADLRIAAELRDQVTRLATGRAVLFGGIFDGNGEAQTDLLPDSPFLTALNARPQPRGVAITVIAARAAPLAEAEVDAMLQPLAQLDAEQAARARQSVRALVSGLGDGAVTLESSRLPGVTDYQVVAGNHITMLRRTVPGIGDLPPALPIVLDRLAQPD